MKVLRKVGTRLAGAIVVGILMIAIAAGPDAARAASASPTATPPSGTSPVRTASSAGQTVRLVYRPHTSAVMRAAGYVAARGVSPESAVNASSSNRVTPNLPDLDLRSVDVPADQVDAAIATLSGRLDVLWVERTAKVRKHGSIGQAEELAPMLSPQQETSATFQTSAVTNDPQVGRQWGLTSSRAPTAWTRAQATNPGTSVIVAVIDTGVQANHPDLTTRMTPSSMWAVCVTGYCYSEASATQQTQSDGDGHGTHVSGIVAAASNNQIGVSGIAGPRPVQILPIQVLDANGNGTTDGVAAGIDWAVSNGAKVINMSLGGDQDTATVNEAIDKAVDKGILVVVSAGNCGTEIPDVLDGNGTVLIKGCKKNEPDYPAAYSGTVSGAGKMIAVAAIDEGGRIASYSTQAPYVGTSGLAAPGSSIYSTYKNSQYFSMSGTSMASPHVAGAAAILLSTYPSLTRSQVRTAILAGASKSDTTIANPNGYGAGLLDIGLSLEIAGSSCVCLTPTASLTASATAVPTATATPTVISTSTRTPTPLSSPTPTPTSTATNTATPTATSTPSVFVGTPVPNLSITNVRDTSFTIAWTTGSATTGAVRWWPASGLAETTTPDKRGAAFTSTVHYVTVDNLSPLTTYRFDVLSGNAIDDCNAAHYSVTTGALINPGSPDTITGLVRVPLGAVSSEAVVIISARTLGVASAPMSALVSTDYQGTWSASLSNLRTQDLSASYVTTGSTTLTLDALGTGNLTAQSSISISTARSGTSAVGITGSGTSMLSLHPGWNLISLPSAPRKTVTTSDLCIAISNASGTTGSTEIDRWISGGWEGVRCDIPVSPFALTPGSGYFVKVPTSVNILVDGVPGQQTTALASGWNLIGLPSTSSLADAPAVLASISGAGGGSGSVVEIDRWMSGAWEGHLSGLPVNKFGIVPGTGYFVRVTSPVTWTR